MNEAAAKKVAADIDPKQTTVETVERIITGMTLTASWSEAGFGES
jgi:hypothetical protein